LWLSNDEWYESEFLRGMDFEVSNKKAENQKRNRKDSEMN